MLKITCTLLFFIALTCNDTPKKQEADNLQEHPAQSGEPKAPPPPTYTEYEKALLQMGLQDLEQADSTLQVELKYATADNFMGRVLYDSISHAFLQPEAVQKLIIAQKKLKTRNSAFSLLVYDAARPNSIQRKMWALVVNTPKQIYVAPPGSGSLHNFGCAVDLTITQNGIPLDMGTPYDFFGEKAQPRYNNIFLEKGELTATQVANRELLRTLMKTAGFIPIDTEWWHFNAFSLPYAKEHYTIVQ